MSKATTAVVIAHLMRCVYFHAAKRRYRVDGRCKASWIAETFGVSERAVVTARRKLIDGGLLIVLESPQWQLNRYGLRLAVDLDYPQGPGAPAERSAPPPSESAGRTADPRANSTLLQKNRTLAPGAGIGVRKRTKKARVRWPGKLEMRDLIDADRLDCVYNRLVASGAVRMCETDRQLIAGAAARAVRKARRNPCGFFYAIIRDRLSANISGLDEANALKAPRERAFPVAKREIAGLSSIQAIVEGMALAYPNSSRRPRSASRFASSS